MGYSNIDCLAWASGAKTIRGYNMRGTFVEFNGWDVLKKYFLEKTSFAWLLINGFITLALFTFITLGLLCEWSLRKIQLPVTTMEKDSADGRATTGNPSTKPRAHKNFLKAFRLGFIKKFSLTLRGSLAMKIVM